MIRNLIIVLCLIFSFQAILSAQNEEVILIEKIDILDKLRIRDGFVRKKYYGVIQNQKELKKIWSKLYDVYNDLNIIINTNDAPVPQIDFNNYSVIWYANRGSGASFVNSIDVIEDSDQVVVKIGIFYSDFGSSHLNLWKVPKITKEVIFEEIKQFETRQFEAVGP